MRISVIITSYNQLSELKRAVNSVLNQTQKPFELIICDDCSKDGSRSYVKELEEDVSFVKAVLHTKNVGVSANRNSGVAVTTGDFITFLDGDDYFYPNKIEQSVQKLQDIGSEVGLYSNFDYDEDKKIWQPKYKGAYPYDFTKIFGRDTLNNKLFRNEIIPKWAFDKVGGFDESISLYEDWDLKIRLSMLCKFKHIDELHSHYTTNNKGLSSVAYNNHINTILYIYNKNSHLIADENQKGKIKTNLDPFLDYLIRKVRSTAGFFSLQHLKAQFKYKYFKWI